MVSRLAEKGFKLDFAFIPFPEDTVEADPPLLQCEWQLLGYLLKQIRFGEALQPLADDELLNGIIEVINGESARIDRGCGLSRNGLKKARESLVERGWLLVSNMSTDPSRPRWMYRLLLKRRAVTSRQQVSQRDSGANGQELSQQVTEPSQFDSAVSQSDSAVSQRDTCNKEDRKYLEKNHIEKPKAENSAPLVEKAEEKQKQANLDTMDLRRYQAEVRRINEANEREGRFGNIYEDQRLAAFRAGLTPERHIQLLKKCFPNDEEIDRIYEPPPLFKPQSTPSEDGDEIRAIAERSLNRSLAGGV